ncbi:MAG TPA: response regulator transcription factor [Kofleriaceae bacterium]
MFRADASGYALKSQCAADIVEAIHVVLAGARYLSPVISRAAIDAELATKSARPLTRLTKREREVFELLIRGNSNDEIAARLFISTRTVETHRAQVVKKLSTHSIVQMQRHAALFGGLGP